jgi:hypothetical protein
MFSWLSKLFAGGVAEAPYRPTGTWHRVPAGAEAVRQFRTTTVGGRFNNPDGTSRQKAILSVYPGMPLGLFFEDNNPKDPDAVAVYAGAAQIGYIDAELAAQIRYDASRGDFTDVTAYRVKEDVSQDGRNYFGIIITVRKLQMPLPPRPVKASRRKKGATGRPQASGERSR